MSKKEMKKRIKKLEKQVLALRVDLAFFRLEKVRELLSEVRRHNLMKKGPQYPCNKRQERKSKMR